MFFETRGKRVCWNPVCTFGENGFAIYHKSKSSFPIFFFLLYLKITKSYTLCKLISAVFWKPNGEKCPVSKIDKDGNGVKVLYNEDGTELGRYTYKDGELVFD